MIDWKKYPDFRVDEFKCPCCGRVEMSTELLKRLQSARYFADVPFAINSGYRCESNNKAVHGKENSAHIKGFAADIACTHSAIRYKIVTALLKAGFTRLEIKETWIHADCDSSLPQEVIF